MNTYCSLKSWIKFSLYKFIVCVALGPNGALGNSKKLGTALACPKAVCLG